MVFLGGSTLNEVLEYTACSPLAGLGWWCGSTLGLTRELTVSDYGRGDGVGLRRIIGGRGVEQLLGLNGRDLRLLRVSCRVGTSNNISQVIVVRGLLLQRRYWCTLLLLLWWWWLRTVSWGKVGGLAAEGYGRILGQVWVIVGKHQ